jgi:hypothetical protein
MSYLARGLNAWQFSSVFFNPLTLLGGTCPRIRYRGARARRTGGGRRPRCWAHDIVMRTDCRCDEGARMYSKVALLAASSS